MLLLCKGNILTCVYTFSCPQNDLMGREQYFKQYSVEKPGIFWPTNCKWAKHYRRCWRSAGLLVLCGLRPFTLVSEGGPSGQRRPAPAALQVVAGADILHRTFHALLLLLFVKNGKCVWQELLEKWSQRGKAKTGLKKLKTSELYMSSKVLTGRTCVPAQHNCVGPADGVTAASEDREASVTSGPNVIRLGWGGWASTWHSLLWLCFFPQKNSFIFKTKTLRPREVEWVVQGHKQTGHFWEVTPLSQRASNSKISCLWDMPVPCHHQCFRQNEVVTCQGCCEEDSCKRVQWPVSFCNFRFCDCSSSFIGLIRPYSSHSPLRKWISESTLLHFFLK